jgi:hypothetical protein
MDPEFTKLQNLKMNILSKGINISTDAKDKLTQSGTVPLSIHEYATTGGITLVFEEGIYVNAPFDEWYCQSPDAILEFDETSEQFVVHFKDLFFPAHILPLPGYLGKYDSKKNLISDTIMSHADRARVSPIFGCAYRCKFCDFNLYDYKIRPVEQILEGLEYAKQDQQLPVKHVLISGGTPKFSDFGYLDNVYEQIIKKAGIPVDVMMAPRNDGIVDRLANWGLFGYSINLELYSRESITQYAPQKKHIGIDEYKKFIERAVQNIGSNGRVRSLLIIGLEPLESTLEGVEFLARMGCDPVLSPFRPAKGTSLAKIPPLSQEKMEYIYLKSKEIAERFGVKLGPRCIPCQHNTLTFPDGSDAYYYS